MEKLSLIWDLLWSKAYVVLTNKRAVVSVPTMDIHKIENVLLLSAQQASLTEFYDRMGEALEEHSRQVELLTGRKGSKLYSKKGKGRK